MLYSDRTYIMGILNVTPDSFSSSGKFADPDAALERAIDMLEEGADIIDVGGESTRPGAAFVSAEEELERVIPVIEKISANIDAKISIDTYKAVVAKEALNAGASIVNDIWGLKAEPEMAKVVAATDAQVVLMHNRQNTIYKDFLDDVLQDLKESLAIAQNAGVKMANIILDPGFGFAKSTEQNLYLLKNMEILLELALPVLVGTSRKSMIGNTLDLPTDQRLEGTIATAVMAIMKGANIIRVHDIKAMFRTARMTDAILRADLGGI